jgi:hypothetical protein
MKSAIAVLAAASVLLPTAIAAQESDVSRRSFTFTESRLEVAVVSAAPGELQIVRGSRGRLDVAARSADGFPGFGLGGRITPQLRLTTAGSGQVNYLVVVPERVAVRVALPDGRTADLPASAQASAWRWAASAEVQPPTGVPAEPVAPGTGRGSRGGASYSWQTLLDAPPEGVVGPADPGRSLPVSYASSAVPAIVDVPDLAAIRSLGLRVEGTEFRVAASRPLVLEPGSRSRFDILVAGDPIDLILYVPATARFTLLSDGMPVAEAVAGQARAHCGNVVVLAPSAGQSWLSFHPQNGRLDCPRQNPARGLRGD